MSLDGDLRVEKTLERIKEQFLSLRKKLPLAKIRVNELCQGAKINKTTFYRHYEDIYDLEDQFEDQAMRSFVEDMGIGENLFEDPERFVQCFFAALNKNRDQIIVLFRENADAFVRKFEKAMLALHPSFTATQEDRIRFSFIIGGAAHVILNEEYERETDLRVITEMLRALKKKEQHPAAG